VYSYGVNKNQQIGFIGTGIMGLPMAMHLIDAGYRLCVFNRTRSKAEPLVERGAVWCDSPAEVASVSTIVFTILGYPSDVESVYLAENGILQAMAAGGICVDMTTSSPSLAVEIAAKAEKAELTVLDAPVSGGDKGACAGTLVVMLGGDQGAFEKVRPLLDCFSANVVRFGGPGTGQHAKMCNQIAIAGAIQGVAEAVAYAQAKGLDVGKLVSCIGGGAAGSWQLNNLAAKMADTDYTPGFMIKHFLKDMKLAVEEAEASELELAVLWKAISRYSSPEMSDYSDEGTQAIFRLFPLIDKE
jgi:3-hydroxyisobutyrate dehydrogenase